LQTIQTETELRAALQPSRKLGLTIGFVPTMGALHEGHLSLIRLSKEKTDVTVVSIFVNPTQFGPNEDFARYPRTVEEDTRLLTDAGVDFLFLPTVETVYPTGAATTVEVGGIGNDFEGAIRPEHFKGVATVVAALFNLVQPNTAFFGQKDAQQVAVIKRMVRDLHFPIEIHIGETVRSEKGFALSSRNRYLTDAQAESAQALSKALNVVRSLLKANGDFNNALGAGRLIFEQIAPSAKLDYLEIVDSETFQISNSFEQVDSCTIIIAARFGATRLIDNMVVNRREIQSE
jgi:pantoate--beta-alanine ligase